MMESSPAQNTARVIRAVGGLYTLADEAGENYLAKPRGIFRKTQFLVLPGDLVCFSPSGDVDIPWRIDEVLPRKNLLLRPPMANLDFVFIVLAMSSPEPDFLFLDKMLAYTASLALGRCIVLTKTDLAETANSESINTEIAAYREAGFDVLESAATVMGESVLSYAEEHLADSVWAFAGASGVGKSSLVNAILNDEYMDTGKVSQRLGRGKHTTRHVELIPFQHGYIVDTPGFSALEVGDLTLSRADLDAAFPDIQALSMNCRFADCRHKNEPACAVKDSLSERALQGGRYARYDILLEQILNAENLRKEGRI